MSEPQNDSNTTRHDVGRFLLLPQGVYDATYNYEQLDLVQKECAVYMSRKSNNIGHAVSDTEWWTKLFDVAEAIRAALSVDAPRLRVPITSPSLWPLMSTARLAVSVPRILLIMSSSTSWSMTSWPPLSPSTSLSSNSSRNRKLLS